MENHKWRKRTTIINHIPIRNWMEKLTPKPQNHLNWNFLAANNRFSIPIGTSIEIFISAEGKHFHRGNKTGVYLFLPVKLVVQNSSFDRKSWTQYTWVFEYTYIQNISFTTYTKESRSLPLYSTQHNFSLWQLILYAPFKEFLSRIYIASFYQCNVSQFPIDSKNVIFFIRCQMGIFHLTNDSL